MAPSSPSTVPAMPEPSAGAPAAATITLKTGQGSAATTDASDRSVIVLPVDPGLSCLRGLSPRRLRFEVEYGLERGTSANSFLFAAGSTAEGQPVPPVLVHPPGSSFAAPYLAVLAELVPADAALKVVVGHVNPNRVALLRELAARKSGPLQVLTHCNAGWLATVDWGTATSPIYQAHAAGLALHVWVDETRPRNQGASLTALELGHEGVPHTVLADNAGGHLMQRGQVDVVIVGCDRVSAGGDVCNKIGTYLKALAARDNGVPFYVAMPTSTLDPTLADGSAIPIEERSAREVTHVSGRAADGSLVEVQLVPDGTVAANPAFDVTPARLVSGLITEHGVVASNAAALRDLWLRNAKDNP